MQRIRPLLLLILASIVFLSSLIFYTHTLFHGPAEPGRTEIQSNLFHYVNSDVMYLPALYDDVFKHSYPVSGWTFPPTPYFFPDLPIYFLFLSIFSTVDAAILSGLAIFTLNLIGFAFFLTQVFQGQKIKTYSAVLFSGALFVILTASNVFPISFKQMLVPTFHSGLIGSFYLCAGLSVSAKKPAFIFYLSIVFLTSFSDRIFSFAIIIHALLMPFYLFHLLHAGSDGFSRKQIWSVSYRSVLTILVVYFSIRLAPMIGDSLHITGIAPEKDVLRSSLDTKIQSLLQLSRWPYWFIASGILVSALMSVSIFMKNRRAFLLFAPVIASLLLLPIGATFSGAVGIPISDRYLFFSIFTAFLLTLFFLIRLFPMELQFSWFPVLSVLMVVLMPHNVQTRSMLDVAQCLDRAAEKYELQSGLGDYWNSKMFTMLSRKVRVHQVDPELGPDGWISNLNWFLHEPGQTGFPKYTFVFPDRLHAETILTRFGKPTAIETCYDRDIWIYNRPSDQKFQSLLRQDFLVWRKMIGR